MISGFRLGFGGVQIGVVRFRLGLHKSELNPRSPI